MGGSLSSFSAPEPPSVVLVPPLLDRERKGRSRFSKSSYDTAFGQPQLRALLGDYLPHGYRGSFYFSPPEDERVSVTAKLNVPQAGGGAPTAGALSLRLSSTTSTPYSFIDIKTRVQGTDSTAFVRACAMDASNNFAAFAQLPLIATSGAPGLGKGDQLRMGLRFTSPGLASGCILSRDTVHSAWVVGRVGSLIVGAQTAPSLGLDRVFSSLSDVEARRAALQSCALATSCAIAYRGRQSTAGGGGFTALVEIQRQSQLSTSFLYHSAMQRNVRNPFEAHDVVGITNYIDLGVSITTDLTGREPASMQLGAAWQVNKNVMVKARVGLDGMAGTLVFRSWLQPSATLAIGLKHDYHGSIWDAKLGVSCDVGTFKTLRYERSPEGQRMSGQRVTQRHVASAEDQAYHEGKGLLIPLAAVDDPTVLGQAHPAGADFL